MGKTLRDEDLRLNIIVNGDKGRKELGDLTEATRKLKEANNDLKKETNLLNTESKKLKESYDRTTKNVKENKEATKKLKVEAEMLAKEKQHLTNLNKQESIDYQKVTSKIKLNENAQQELKTASVILRAEQKELREEYKLQKSAISKVNNEIKQNSIIIDGNKVKMKVLKSQIGITGMSINELSREARTLRIQLNNAVPGTTEWKRYRTELKKVDNRLLQLRTRSKGIGSSFSKMAIGFNKYFGMVTMAIAAIFGAVASTKELITGNARLSDSYSDVAKYTELTIGEVKELDKQLKTIDTRSSRKELRELAQSAGRLGVRGTKHIFDFVEAADKIGVSLGEDLGGNAKTAIKEVGKLVDIFKVKNEFGLSKGLKKVGSVINALGSASTANEGYIVEFTKRLAGIAPTAKIPIDAVMGLGATLDSLGQTAEVSSTVLSQLIPNMFKDVDTYAQMAGKSTNEFSQTLATDANEALIQVFEGLHKNSNGLGTMARKLDELGLSGKKNISVIGVLANNTEILRKQQALANEEFIKGTSLTKEFNLKNENLAAKLNKIGKRLRGMFINSSFMESLEKSVNLIERWTRTKLSSTLEKERIELRKLEIKLASSNIKQADRVKLIKELQQKYPNYLGNINAETVSNDKLKSSLKAVNEMLINKIILQKEDEEIEKKNIKVSEAKRELLKTEDQLLNALVKTREDNFKTLPKELDEMNGSIMEQAQATYRYLLESRNNIYKKMYGRSPKNKNVIDLDINPFMKKYNQIQAVLDELQTDADKAVEEKQKLMERLGIKDEPSSQNNDGNSEVDALNKKIEDLNKKIEDTKNRKLKINTKDAENALFELWQKEEAMANGGIGEYRRYVMTRKTEDENYADWKSRLNEEVKEDELLKQKRTLERQAIERETAYLKELSQAGNNEEKKAEITRRYRLKELEEQKKAVLQALKIAEEELEKAEKKVGLEILSEDKKNIILFRIAEIKRELAELENKEVNIKINNPNQTVDSEEERKKQKALNYNDTNYGKSLNQQKEEEFENLNNEFGIDEETGEMNLDELNEEEEIEKILTYHRRVEEIEQDYFGRKAERYQQFFQMASGIMSSLTDYQASIYNKEIVKEKNKATEEIRIINDKLEKGLISEKKANEQKKIIREDLSAYEETMRKEAFESEKKMRIAQAIMNTALSFTSALTVPPPKGPILAAYNLAKGKLQIATIQNEEYTAQAEEGGYTDVIGQTDRKKYRAKVTGQGGGYYPQPTLLVGEEPEYVIPQEGLKNPAIAEMLPILEEARTSGTLRDISKEALWGTPSYSKQMATGGFSEPTTTDSSDSNNDNAYLKDLLHKMIDTQNRLDETLRNGINANLNRNAITDIAEEMTEQQKIAQMVS